MKKTKKLFSKISSNPFLKSVMGYSGILAVQKIFPFLLIPLYTNFFPKEDFGRYILCQTIVQILIPLLVLGGQSVVSVNYFRLPKSKFPTFLSSILTTTLISSIIWSALLYTFGTNLENITTLDRKWLSLLGVVIFPQFINNIRLTIYRNQNRLKQYATTAIGVAVVSSCVGVFFALYYNMTWKGVIYGILIGEIFFSIISTITLYKEFKIKLSLSLTYVKELLKMGLPISLHQLGLWFSSAYNKFIINVLIGLSATGSYGAAAIFGMMQTFLSDALNMAYAPYLYSMLTDVNNKTNIIVTKYSLVFYTLLSILAGSLSVFGYYFAPYILGSKYAGIEPLVIPLILASLFSGYYKIHVNFLFYYKKTTSIAKVTFALGILNIPLGYLLVSKFGIIGAAYSSALIQFASYRLILRSANKVYPIKWRQNIKNICFKIKT